MPARLGPGTANEVTELGLTYEDDGTHWIPEPGGASLRARPITRFGDFVVAQESGGIVVFDTSGAPRVTARFTSVVADPVGMGVRGDVAVVSHPTNVLSRGLPHLEPRHASTAFHPYVVHPRLPLAVVFDGKDAEARVASTFRVTDLRTGEPGPRRSLGAEPLLIDGSHAFSPHGLRFAVATPASRGPHGGLAVTNLDTGESFTVARAWSDGDAGGMPKVAFTADGSGVCLKSAIGTTVTDVRRRQLLSNEEAASRTCTEGTPPQKGSWSPLLPSTAPTSIEVIDSLLVMRGAEPQSKAATWDLLAGRPRADVHLGCVVAVSPNGRWLVTSDDCTTLQELERIDLRTGATSKHALPCIIARITPEIAVSDSGRRVAYVANGKAGVVDLGARAAPAEFCEHGAVASPAGLAWVGDEAVAMAREATQRRCEVSLYDTAQNRLWTRELACPGRRPPPMVARDGVLAVGDSRLSLLDGADIPPEPLRHGARARGVRIIRGRPMAKPAQRALFAGEEEVAKLVGTTPWQTLAFFSNGSVDVLGSDTGLPASLACQIGPVLLPFAVCAERLVSLGALSRMLRGEPERP